MAAVHGIWKCDDEIVIDIYDLEIVRGVRDDQLTIVDNAVQWGVDLWRDAFLGVRLLLTGEPAKARLARPHFDGERVCGPSRHGRAGHRSGAEVPHTSFDLGPSGDAVGVRPKATAVGNSPSAPLHRSAKMSPMESTPITAALAAPGAFWTFNREERNAVAVLFGLLTRPGNLATFCSKFEWQPGDLADAEVAVEWTFLRDLWNHHSRRTDPATLRSAILDTLQPAAAASLRECPVLEFNAHFGAVPRPSATYVQSPSNWSVRRFDDTIADNDEFVATCRFKWAFNVKPDLVIQTPSGRVLCIEAKWDSGEGTYPASEPEKSIFARRQIPYVSQTEVQRYLVNDVLGFDGEFVFLARTHIDTAAGRAITWAEALNGLDHTGAPAFVEDWCRAVLAA